MKKLLSILLVIIFSLNILGVIAYAEEMDNNWHYVPPDTDEQMLQSYEDLENISAKYLRGLINNSNLTDVQKILILHDRIIENCEYDLSYTNRYATHALIDGCAVCTGYSYAFRFLLDKLGIKSNLETSDVMNHLWNIVYLDGKKYYIDLTYDDPSYDMSGNVLHKNFLISSARFSQTHGNVTDYDMTLKNTEYQDQYWINSNTAFQLIGDDIYYIDNVNAKLMKVGSSSPLVSLTKDWKISATSYYPGNFSRLASDGYNLYFSDDNSIYKYDVKTKAKTEVYKLDSSFNKYDNIYGFTFKNCELIFEACHDLNWDENTKHTIQKRVAVDHYYKNSDLQSDSTNHWQECLVCGHKNNVEKHNFSAGYKSDETNHWMVCSKCNVKKDIQEHVYTDNCDESCDICGYLRTAPHYQNGVWYSNSSQHWHKCDNCGFQYGLADHNWNSGTVIEEATCTTQGSGKFKCLDCGKEEIVPIQNKLHTEVIDPAVAATCTTDGKTEGKHCSVCKTVIVPQNVIPATGHSIVTVSKVNPTCTKPGTTEWSHCEKCDYVEVSPSQIPAKGHNFNLSWSGDTSTHWLECSDCGAKKDEEAHTWNSGSITKNPTCTSSGIKTYVCTVCNKAKTEFTQKLDHTPDIDEGVPATCTTSGLTEGSHCSVCFEVIKAQEVIPPKGHTLMGGWLYDTDKHWHKCAVCKAEVDQQNHLYDNSCDTTCNVCGAIRSITHSYNSFFSSDENNHWKECYVCGDRIEIGNHKYDSSCDDTCDECGYVRTVEHATNGIWKSDKSSHWQQCTRCRQDVNKADHIFDNSCDTTCNVCGYVRSITHSSDAGKITKAPTCIADGKKTYTCMVCGKVLKTETVPKTPDIHTWDNGKSTKIASCSEFGEITYTCTVCGLHKTKTVQKSDHTYSQKWSSDKSYHWHICTECSATTDKIAHKSDSGKVTTKATLSKAGKKTYKCSICAKVLKTVSIAYPKTIKLGISTYTYNGKVQKPSVTVKDSKGKTIGSGSYTVTYAKGCKNVGTYKVSVKFKGAYSGTKTLSFKILPKNISLSTLTSPKKKQIRFSWKKDTAQTTGYQIQYSTDKAFMKSNFSANVTNTSITSVLIKGLNSKKTYYVRIRRYKTVGKTKYYSAWSKTKSVKCK